MDGAFHAERSVQQDELAFELALKNRIESYCENSHYFLITSGPYRSDSSRSLSLPLSDSRSCHASAQSALRGSALPASLRLAGRFTAAFGPNDAGRRAEISASFSQRRLVRCVSPRLLDLRSAAAAA